jgi:hypothetical protein
MVKSVITNKIFIITIIIISLAVGVYLYQASRNKSDGNNANTDIQDIQETPVPTLESNITETPSITNVTIIPSETPKTTSTGKPIKPTTVPTSISNIQSLSGKSYTYTLLYPNDWTVKSQSTSENNVESVRIVPKSGSGIAFNLSIYPGDSAISMRKDYEEESRVQIQINGKSYSSILYKPADWTDFPENQKIVYISFNDKPNFISESSFDSNIYKDGWNKINDIAKTVKY